MSRRFQFSLRGCLVLTTVVCVWLGWKAESFREPAETEEEAVAAIEALGGDVQFGEGMVPEAVLFMPHGFGRGDTSHIKLTDDGLRHVRFLKRLTNVWLHEVPISDAGLSRLHGLKNLSHIGIWRTQTTPEGVAALKKSLPNCAIDWVDDRPKLSATGEAIPYQH